ncbi:MAG: ribosome biogenesis GTP-binding protein YihA/YsxC [Bacillota bacterium]
MKIAKSDIIISAVSKKQWPDTPTPEFAFAGKSNVGKSSFINMALNRKKLARTSQRPGKTRTINFYNVDDKIKFVDLPGYGFAKVSKEEKDKWGNMMEEYISKRKNLLEVIMLVDLRHSPTEDDRLMYDYILQMGFNGIVLATKADKVKNSKFQKSLKRVREKLKMRPSDVLLPVSAKDKRGKYEFWDMINQLLEVNGFKTHFERQ